MWVCCLISGHKCRSTLNISNVKILTVHQKYIWERTWVQLFVQNNCTIKDGFELSENYCSMRMCYSRSELYSWVVCNIKLLKDFTCTFSIMRQYCAQKSWKSINHSSFVRSHVMRGVSWAICIFKVMQALALHLW